MISLGPLYTSIAQTMDEMAEDRSAGTILSICRARVDRIDIECIEWFFFFQILSDLPIRVRCIMEHQGAPEEGYCAPWYIAPLSLFLTATRYHGNTVLLGALHRAVVGLLYGLELHNQLHSVRSLRDHCHDHDRQVLESGLAPGHTHPHLRARSFPYRVPSPESESENTVPAADQTVITSVVQAVVHM
jgi:hypothetical protein